MYTAIQDYVFFEGETFCITHGENSFRDAKRIADAMNRESEPERLPHPAVDMPPMGWADYNRCK